MDKAAMKGELSTVQEECGVACVTPHGMLMMLLWCVDNWDMPPQVYVANITCTTLFTVFLLGITPVYNASFGQGAGPVIIDTVICRGNETDINNCTLTTPSSCSHSKDAGVKCSG